MLKKAGLLLCAYLGVCQSAALTESEFAALAEKCAPHVAYDTLRALVKTESSFNPLAIAVVGGRAAQPATLSEAHSAVLKLKSAGKSYSLGLGQINSQNFEYLKLQPLQLFDPCINLGATSQLLGNCYARTAKQQPTLRRLTDALSCYYSGNEQTGYQHGYVAAVLKNAALSVPSLKESVQAETEDSEPSASEALIQPAATSKGQLIF